MTADNPALRAELLSITGSDAVAFAHAQFSSDVRTLADGQWQWSAWLDVRGRVRALLRLARIDGEHLQALVCGGRAGTLAEALRPYQMRAKVTLQAHSPGLLHAGPAMPMHAFRHSAAGQLFGCGDYSLQPAAEVATEAPDPHAWRLAAIRAGHPWLPDAALDTFVPQALSLERLAAVSFGKGCFPGQEIAARLHYRGGPGRHLCHVVSQQPIHAGDTLHQASAAVGMLLDAVPTDSTTHEALAVLHDGVAAQSPVSLQCAESGACTFEIVQIFGA